MDEPVSSRADSARIAALERNDATQDGQIRELFQRVNSLERQQSAQGATLQGMQTDISEAKTAAQQANDKLDGLKTWMLGIAVSTVVTLILALINLVASKL